MTAFDPTGYVEKRKKNGGVIYYEDGAGVIVAKVCTNCGEVKSTTQYSKHHLCLAGVNAECKTCKSVKRKVHYENNRERTLATNLLWREKNKERYTETTRQYREGNKERYKELSRRWKKIISKEQRRIEVGGNQKTRTNAVYTPNDAAPERQPYLTHSRRWNGQK